MSQNKYAEEICKQAEITKSSVAGIVHNIKDLECTGSHHSAY